MRKSYTTLGACWLIFFINYASSVMLAAFLPNSDYGMAIGQLTVGAVFAAYPLATALAIPIPPWCVARFGIRFTVGLGLLLSSAGSLLCGLMPFTLGSFADSPYWVATILIVWRSLSGLGAALAEAACFTALSVSDFGGRMGIVMSSCEVVIGVGSAVGTAMGGLLYEAGASTVFTPWGLPFLPCAVGPLALLACLPALPPKATPAERLSDAADALDVLPPSLSAAGSAAPPMPRRQRSALVRVCSPNRALGFFSVFCGSAMVEALAPIVQPYALRPPLRMSNATVGYMFSFYNVCYMGVALP
jgi:MFS family permease